MVILSTESTDDFLRSVRAGLGAHAAPTFNMNRELLYPESSGRGLKLTTHLHLVPRLRIRKAISPLPAGFQHMHKGKFTFTFTLKSQLQYIHDTSHSTQRFIFTVPKDVKNTFGTNGFLEENCSKNSQRFLHRCRRHTKRQEGIKMLPCGLAN